MTTVPATETTPLYEFARGPSPPRRTKQRLLDHLHNMKDLFDQLPVGDNTQCINEYFLDLEYKIETGEDVELDHSFEQSECELETDERSVLVQTPNKFSKPKDKQQNARKSQGSTTIEQLAVGDKRRDPFNGVW